MNLLAFMFQIFQVLLNTWNIGTFDFDSKNLELDMRASQVNYSGCQDNVVIGVCQYSLAVRIMLFVSVSTAWLSG